MCIEGSDRNCEIYKTNEDACQTCKNGYYLNQIGACNIQLVLNNCVSYSRTVESVCVECDQNSMLFTNEKVCLPAI